jgi:hypothetical protein
VSAFPATEVETGDSTTSGFSDVYTVFYVDTDPVYAEQPVEISSPELEDRCGGGWRFEPSTGTAITQASGTTVATGTLDDDGNATFVFKGADCAPGTSTVTADIVAGTQPTYTTTFTIDSPAVTLATHKLSAAPKASKTKHRRRHHRGPTATTPPTVPPAMTVTASPNALVETGATPEATLNVVKSDDASPEPGTSSPPTTGEIDCGAHGITYYITVTNSGPDDLDAVQVQDSFSGNADGDFDSDRYTATDAGGASGYTALAIGPGFNDIDDIVDLPSGSSITYTVTATIDNDDTSLTNTATLTPPSGVELTADSNLSATDNDDFYCGG